MIEEMAFVYSLSCKGNVFYIGCTKDIAKRYVPHLRGDACCYSYEPIKEFKQDNKLIELKILYHLPIEEAFTKEAEIIVLFTKAGHNLANSARNKFNSKYGWYWEKIPANITNSSMPKYLKALQEIKEYYYKWHLDNKTDAKFTTKLINELYEQTESTQ